VRESWCVLRVIEDVGCRHIPSASLGPIEPRIAKLAPIFGKVILGGRNHEFPCSALVNVTQVSEKVPRACRNERKHGRGEARAGEPALRSQQPAHFPFSTAVASVGVERAVRRRLIALAIGPLNQTCTS
jgi:hypothetical protein